MRVALVILCLSACAWAQQPARWNQHQDQPRLAAACGPANISFKVNLDRTQHGPALPVEGKALIYLIHDAGIPFEHLTIGYPTTKYGLDGAWVGAGHGDSWFAVPVSPGEHHICTTLQSSFVDKRVELAHVEAEAGKSYYFRTRLVMSQSVELLELNRIDSDEGQYLVSEYPLATARRKN